MNKLIWLTGGSGIIGHHLAQDLKTLGYMVFTPTRGECNLLDSLNVQQYYHEHFPNPSQLVILHTAWGSNAMDNLRMFFNLTHGLSWDQFYTIGSGSEFDKTKPLLQINEASMGACPWDEMAAAKWIINRYCQNTDIVNLRLFGVIAEGEPNRRLFHSIWNQSQELHKIIIKEPNRLVSWIDVHDMSALLHQFIQNYLYLSGVYQDYNLCNLEIKTNLEWATMMRDLIDPKIPILTLPDCPPHYTGSTA